MPFVLDYDSRGNVTGGHHVKTLPERPLRLFLESPSSSNSITSTPAMASNSGGGDPPALPQPRGHFPYGVQHDPVRSNPLRASSTAPDGLFHVPPMSATGETRPSLLQRAPLTAFQSMTGFPRIQHHPALPKHPSPQQDPIQTPSRHRMFSPYPPLSRYEGQNYTLAPISAAAMPPQLHHQQIPRNISVPSMPALLQSHVEPIQASLNNYSLPPLPLPRPPNFNGNDWTPPVDFDTTLFNVEAAGRFMQTEKEREELSTAHNENLRQVKHGHKPGRQSHQPVNFVPVANEVGTQSKKLLDNLSSVAPGNQRDEDVQMQYTEPHTLVINQAKKFAEMACRSQLVSSLTPDSNVFQQAMSTQARLPEAEKFLDDFEAQFPKHVEVFRSICRAFAEKRIDHLEFYLRTYRLMLLENSFDLFPRFLAFFPESWRTTDLTWLNKRIFDHWNPEAVQNRQNALVASEISGTQQSIIPEQELDDFSDLVDLDPPSELDEAQKEDPVNKQDSAEESEKSVQSSMAKADREVKEPEHADEHGAGSKPAAATGTNDVAAAEQGVSAGKDIIVKPGSRGLDNVAQSENRAAAEQERVDDQKDDQKADGVAKLDQVTGPTVTVEQDTAEGQATAETQNTLDPATVKTQDTVAKKDVAESGSLDVEAVRETIDAADEVQDTVEEVAIEATYVEKPVEKSGSKAVVKRKKRPLNGFSTSDPPEKMQNTNIAPTANVKKSTVTMKTKAAAKDLVTRKPITTSKQSTALKRARSPPVPSTPLMTAASTRPARNRKTTDYAKDDDSADELPPPAKKARTKAATLKSAATNARGRKAATRMENEEHVANDPNRASSSQKPRAKEGKGKKASTKVDMSGENGASDANEPSTIEASDKPKNEGSTPLKLSLETRKEYRGLPGSRVLHVGPIYSSKNNILARASKPYIAANCGARFKHPMNARSHSHRSPCCGIGNKARDDWNAHSSCQVDYRDISYAEVKDGWVILDQESHDKVEAAIAAGLEYIKERNMKNDEAGEAGADGEGGKEDIDEDAEHESDEDVDSTERIMSFGESHVRAAALGLRARSKRTG